MDSIYGTALLFSIIITEAIDFAIIGGPDGGQGAANDLAII